MDNTGDIDLSAAFKKLLAENKSQEIRLEEYAAVINSRNSEIEMLQSMLLEANENRSNMDNQVNQLKELQRHMNELQQQSALSIYTASGRQQAAGEKVAPERQLENLTIAYADLQSQLTNLQSQLQDINNRNLLLQQQTSRIASLESLLANAEKEIEEIKQKSNPEL